MLMILRQKSDWQFGKLNMLGGRIEAFENAEEAALRELKEEANVDAIGAALIGEMHYPEAKVSVVDCPFDPDVNEVKSSSEGEVLWLDSDQALRDPRLIPNLRVIIPLAVVGMAGWNLYGVPGASDELVTLDLAGCTRQGA
jgi:8-oxo-dGTP pyrophosphatase MutT (NUDIX family)